jgi:hypothetical protein
VTVVLLHQNMRSFSGGDPQRTTAYLGAFKEITSLIGGNTLLGKSIGVVGLTEVTGKQYKQSCDRIFDVLGVKYVASVDPGATALGFEERIVIGVDTDRFEFLGKGLIQPKEDAVDYRGAVYAVLRHKLSDTVLVVAFIHSVYTLKEQRAWTAGQITRIMKELAGLADGGGPVFLGGDFNVEPKARGDLVPLAAVPTAYVNGVGRAGGTTWSGSLYDYWYSTFQGALHPAAFSQTLDSSTSKAMAEKLKMLGDEKMSDHCAVTLSLESFG